MFLCHALKANGRACRAYASVLEKSVDRDGAPVITYAHTCRHHRSFFEGTRWKEKFLGWIWYTQYIWQIPYHHVEYVLSSGAVTVTEAEVAALEVRGYSWYLYLLFARHVPGVSRKWNTALCEKAQEMIWRRMDSIGPLTLTFADLGHTLGEEYTYELFRCLRFFPTHARPELSRDEWLSAVYLILLTGPHIEILTSPHLEKTLEMMKGGYAILPNLESLLADGTLAEQLLEARNDLYKKRIGYVNVDAFREELLAVAWEPSRVVNWCADFDGEFKVKAAGQV